MRRHVFCHDGICADSGVVANSDRPQYLCAGSDVDMAADDRDTRSTPDAQSDLLKNETIYANRGVGVNDDSVGMRDQEPPANLTGKGYIRAGYNAPEPVADDQPIAKNA